MKIALLDVFYTKFDTGVITILLKKIPNIKREDVLIYRIDKSSDYIAKGDVPKTLVNKNRNETITALKEFKPDVILTFSNKVFHSLIDQKGFGNLIEKPFWFEELNCKVIPLHDLTYYFNNRVKLEILDLNSLIEKDINKDFNVEVLLDHKSILNCLEEANKQSEVAFDVETNGLNPFASDLKMLSLGIAYGNLGFAFPLDSTVMDIQPTLFKNKIEELVVKLFSNKNIKLVGQNTKFDVKMIEQRFGVKITNTFEDTMLLHHAIDEEARHNLQTLLATYGFMNHKGVDFNDPVYSTGIFPNIKSLNDFLVYNAKDAISTLKLRNIMLKSADKNTKLVYKIMNKVSYVLTQIENNGIRVPLDALNKLEVDYIQQKNILEQRMLNYKEVKLAGIEDLNFNSTQHIGKIFIAGGYTITDYTAKGQISTSNASLQKLSNKPFVADLLEYRKLSKIINGYLAPYKDKEKQLIINEHIHPNFRITGTKTGRLSCSNPNLQQIPSSIKAMFYPEKNEYLVNMDYSQAELRVLTMFTHDPNLTKAYTEDLDLHTFTASLIFNKPMEQIEKSERRVAKTINFGIVYGMGAKSLAENLSISETKANKFLRQWNTSYSRVALFFNGVVKEASQKGFVVTPFGRKRHLKDINSFNTYHRSKAQRQAGNFVIQSTANEFNLLTLIKVQNYIERENLKTKLVNTVHDSIMLSVPKEELIKVLPKIKFLAENYNYKFMSNIPLKADISIGLTWKDQVDLEKLTTTEILNTIKELKNV